MEIWKDIYFIENGIEYDYRGLYQVSNHGRVKSLGNGNSNFSKERILKPFSNGGRYYRICLCKESKEKKFLIHRLVAHMFLGDFYFNGAEVDHIDNNIFNNHVDNLKWCDHKENQNNSLTKKRHTKQRTGISSNGQLIARYDLNMNLIDVKYQFEFVQMGFSRSTIWRCCVGKIENFKGFIFKYHEKDD